MGTELPSALLPSYPIRAAMDDNKPFRISISQDRVRLSPVHKMILQKERVVLQSKGQGGAGRRLGARGSRSLSWRTVPPSSVMRLPLGPGQRDAVTCFLLAHVSRHSVPCTDSHPPTPTHFVSPNGYGASLTHNPAQRKAATPPPRPPQQPPPPEEF